MYRHFAVQPIEEAIVGPLGSEEFESNRYSTARQIADSQNYILYALQVQVRKDASTEPEDEGLFRSEGCGNLWRGQKCLFLRVVVKNLKGYAELILVMASHVFSNGDALGCANEDLPGLWSIREDIAMVSHMWNVVNAQVAGYPVRETQASKRIDERIDQIRAVT